jgi:hypothetical protein
MLTPQEKAEELVRKYYSFGINNVPFSSFSWFECKACAIIAVDELIRIAPWGSDIDGEIEDDSKEYYIEVKQEIEKL